MRYLKYYFEIIKANINLKMTYKLNFWLGCISDLLMYTIQIAVFKVVYCNVDTINGWSMEQMIFFLGVFFVIDSLAMVTFFIGIISLPDLIRTGGLDLYKVKPINVLFNVATSRFEVGFIPNIFYGIVLIVYATIRMDISINVVQVFTFLIILFLMYILYFLLTTIAYSSAFWFVRVSSITEIHHQFINFSFRIPGVAFEGIWKKIFMCILPYGLIATIPTQIFTNVLDYRLIAYAVIVDIIFTLIMYFIWNIGMKRYDSASS